GMGMSLYDQLAVKQSFYANQAARYNLYNSQAAANYQAANLMQQQAIATAMQYQAQAQDLAQKYALDKQQSWAQKYENAASNLDSILGPNGTVMWPAVTPNDKDLQKARQELDQALVEIDQQLRSSGRASVASLVNARQKLYAFGKPALSRLRARSAAGSNGPIVLRDFLNNLDATLITLGARS
ncbi:MAG: hypothetical protein IRY99_12100, partial [Isosphaeraceae bacterium]|nr:hypothetical protein [Isosphaeraceae bacterium]